MSELTSLRRVAAAAIAIAGGSLVFAAAHASATTVPPGDDFLEGACQWVDPAAVAGVALHEAAPELDELSTLYAAIVASSLDDQLAGEGPFTVFAPSNAAMSEIPTNVFDAMLADPALLDSVLGHHIVVGEALAPDALAAAGIVQTLNGPLTITVAADTVQLGDGAASVTCGGIQTADAVVYVIDHVLQPADVAATGCPGSSSVPGSSVPDASVPMASTPMASVPDSSTPGSSVPC